MISNQQDTLLPDTSSPAEINSYGRTIILDGRPNWVYSQLKEFKKKPIRYFASVIMDHYLIVLAQADESRHSFFAKPRDNDNNEDEEEVEDSASLLVCDLLDLSVQEVAINKLLFASQEHFCFVKYGENQILMFSDCLYHS